MRPTMSENVRFLFCSGDRMQYGVQAVTRRVFSGATILSVIGFTGCYHDRGNWNSPHYFVQNNNITEYVIHRRQDTKL